MIFEKPHNEIVDTNKKMKKFVPSEEVKVNTEKLISDVQEKVNKIKSKM